MKNKTIWFDLSNSPHINLFSKIIQDLRKEFNIIITTRDLGNSITLLEREKLNYKIVGNYYKKGKICKTYAFIERIFKLRRYLKKKRIHLAVSQSSFQSPPTAALLGVKSLYMNDNEHAQGNIPAFLFADKVLLPEYFPRNIAKKQLASAKKIIYYPGLKEGIYLWDKHDLFYTKPDNLKDKNIYIRPEPWTAMYYKGGANFLDNVIYDLSLDGYRITILPRDNEQKKHYIQLNYNNVSISESNLTLSEICSDCMLFIGAGGTMTREMAILGYPTISVYQDELLEVDKYLVENDYLIHSKYIDKKVVINFLENFNEISNNYELIKKGKEAYNLLREEIKKMVNKD